MVWTPIKNLCPLPQLADRISRRGNWWVLIRSVGAKATKVAQLGFSFGGGWTERKLGMLEEYLKAWVKVMKNQPFERAYIDAFAGTGYREVIPALPDTGFFAPELAENEPQEFFDGSARKALRIEPPFHRYVFIEKTA